MLTGYDEDAEVGEREGYFRMWRFADYYGEAVTVDAAKGGLTDCEEYATKKAYEIGRRDK